ncbi:hypothetical protein [Acetobacteroides hydrogenigenes]|uniref:Uncharacterized protein n=1 Tax=Acetobacteroides hydrogenigenes TaxID=979970 RepID=A0A4R2EGZ4_9BACT|nr:hypothetical protein [Acetobacteroides hydrogenigenes]TCN67671.1 hypothetical protein CLV25_107130 [Acetobacteroides hydrogenigenes]
MATSITTSIPRTFGNFNFFIRNTNSYMEEGTPKNSERLGIPIEIATSWKGIEKKWITAYDKYSDRYNLRTQAVNDELRAVIDEAHTFNAENHFLARIAISENATVTDLETFGIRNGTGQKQPRSIPQSPITSLVEVTLKPIGGGSVMVKCYSKGARASILDAADSVQYRFVVGATAPSSAEDPELDKEISTKASFVLPTGAEKIGMFLYVYFRWYNIKHPELAGPWSTLQSTIII